MIHDPFRVEEGGLDPATLGLEADRRSTTTPPANWQFEMLNFF